MMRVYGLKPTDAEDRDEAYKIVQTMAKHDNVMQGESRCDGELLLPFYFDTYPSVRAIENVNVRSCYL